MSLVSRFSYKSLILILLFLLIPIVLFLRISQKTKDTYANWWDDTWMYRQSINISSHTSDETDVYITTTISLSSTDKAQTDAGDFRFLNSTGQILPYYLVSGAGSTSITFHINLDSFPAGAQTLYAYYGNPSATNGFSASDFTTEASNYTLGSQGTEEVGGGPIAYWKFDEGVGTTAYDSSSNQNHAVFGIGGSSPSWISEDQCISGKCLQFDNIDDVLSTSYINLTNTFTVSLWLKANSFNPTTDDGILSECETYTAGKCMHLVIRAGKPYLGFYSNDLQANTTLETNKWYHLTYQYDGTQQKIFINGKLNNSKTTTSFDGQSGTIYIGKSYNNNGFTFDGLFDEFKIYPYARSPDQIKADYAAGLAGTSTSSDTTASFGTSSTKFLSDGLVGYWKFDEGVGTTSADSSGNNNLVTFATGDSAPSWVSGKYGIGTSFGGINYLDVGTTQNITNSITLTAWVKPTSGGVVIGKWASHGLVVGPNYIKWVIWGKDWNTYPTIPINQWSYITAIYDYNKQLRTVYVNGVGVGETETTGTLAINSNPYSIGKWSAQEFFQGSLDEIRVYNRALSPTEVKQLYEYAPGPVAYWKMDEKNGQEIKDYSGNNYFGTFGTGGSSPSWTIGKYGGGLNFDGSDFVDHNDVLDMSISNLTISTWIKTNNVPSTQYFLSKAKAAAQNYRYAIGLLSPGLPRLFMQGDGGADVVLNSSINIADNKWHHISYIFDRDGNASIYIDGKYDSSVSISHWASVNMDSSNPFRIGSYTASDNITPISFFNGSLDEVKIYNYARTQKQILEDMNATSPVGGSSSKVADPIAHYKFDEGFGSTTANWGIGGTALNGTLYGNPLPTWTNGKNNKSLNFVSSASNRVKIPVTSTNGLDIRGPISFSLWYKRNTANDYQTLVSLADSCGSVDADGNGLRFFNDTLYFSSYINDATAPNPFTLSYSNPNITGDTNNWHHVTVTWDGTTTTNGAKMYFDGKQTSQTTAVSDSSLMPSLNGAQLTIGSLICDAHLFNGLIDEVKIYNYALSADQIKQDYNQSSSAVFGSTSQTIGATTTSLEYCVPGSTDHCAPPVGEWKFDEGVGTTAYDGSGNNSHGVFGTGTSSPSWSIGKIGKALNFSTNKYIDAGTGPNFNITGSVTIQAWVKPNTGTGQQGIIGNSVFQYPFGLYLRHSPGSDVGFWVNPDGNRSYMMAGTINYGSWNHITGTWDGTNLILYINGQFISNSKTTDAYSRNFTNLLIGNVPGIASPVYFDGLIDQVRIYNYARTPAQIAYDYNRGEPVGWWKMDECQGTLINDWSGNANHGTLSIGSSGTQTSPGTCEAASDAAWYNGKLGKLNASLNFDGSDDYVSVTDPSSGLLDFNTQNFSTSAWIKTTNNSEDQYYLQKGATSLSTPGYSSYITTSGQIGSRICDGLNQVDSRPVAISNQTGLNNGQWHHVVTTYNRDTNITSIFINGKLDNTTDISSISGNSINTSSNFEISRSAIHKITGQIDDVRIYNYALTPTQIKTIYNNGSVNFR